MNLIFSKYKLLFLLVVMLSLTVLFFSVTSHYETKGYNKALVEVNKSAAIEINLATKSAINAANIEIAKALERQKTLNDAERIRITNQVVVETKIREVINDVEKIVYVEGSCANIDSGFIRLLNNSISNTAHTPSD